MATQMTVGRHLSVPRATPVVQRFAPALIALLAAVALVTAAGSFDAVDGPSVSVDSTPEESVDRQRGGNAPPTPNGDESSAVEGGKDQTTAAPAEGGGGVSALLVAALLGTLAIGGVLVVLLTDDDARAPERDEKSGGERDPPSPAVDPDYESPPDGTVVRAWQALADRTDADDAATPGETARAALDRGLSPGPVDRVTRRFEAVRYGPVEDQECADRANESGRGDANGAGERS